MNGSQIPIQGYLTIAQFFVNVERFTCKFRPKIWSLSTQQARYNRTYFFVGERERERESEEKVTFV